MCSVVRRNMKIEDALKSKRNAKTSVDTKVEGYKKSRRPPHWQVEEPELDEPEKLLEEPKGKGAKKETPYRSEIKPHTEANDEGSQKQTITPHRSKVEGASITPHESKEASASITPHGSDLNPSQPLPSEDVLGTVEFVDEPESSVDFYTAEPSSSKIENHTETESLASIPPHRSKDDKTDRVPVEVIDQAIQGAFNGPYAPASIPPHESKESTSETPHRSNTPGASITPHGSQINPHMEAKHEATQKQNVTPHGSKESSKQALTDSMRVHGSKSKPLTEANHEATQKQGASAQLLNGLVPKKPKSRERLFDLLKGTQLAMLELLHSKVKDTQTFETGPFTQPEIARALGVGEGNVKGNYRQIREKGFVEVSEAVGGRGGYVKVKFAADLYWFLSSKKNGNPTQKQAVTPHGSKSYSHTEADQRARGSSSEATLLIEQNSKSQKATTTVLTPKPYTWMEHLSIPQNVVLHRKQIEQLEREDGVELEFAQKGIDNLSRALYTGAHIRKGWDDPIAVFMKAMLTIGHFTIKDDKAYLKSKADNLELEELEAIESMKRQQQAETERAERKHNNTDSLDDIPF